MRRQTWARGHTQTHTRRRAHRHTLAGANPRGLWGMKHHICSLPEDEMGGTSGGTTASGANTDSCPKFGRLFSANRGSGHQSAIVFAGLPTVPVVPPPPPPRDDGSPPPPGGDGHHTTVA